MKLSEKKTAARLFAEKWKDKGYEKGESEKFWLELLQNVLGVSNVFDFIKFEEQVHLDHTSFIDAWIPLTHVLIEQKSVDKDLRKKIKQSDGTELTPFQQAKRYSMELPYSDRPRWIVTCNFQSFLIYDMENPSGEPQEVLLKNLGKEFYRLEFINELGNEHIEKEMEISLKAGDLVGEIYDAFSKQYLDITKEHSIQSLNKLCVRLVFCLYAEDACLFGDKGAFHEYLSSFDYKHQRQALIDLFKVLNTPYAERDPYMDEKLAEFPYVNGGMFADDNIEIPQFTEEISKLVLSKAADDFDWSDISPTIFGAVFESTLNPETRRSGGMHYTSIENIHKVIDPLFLDELKEEFKEIKGLKRDRDYKLEEFQRKLASLKFLDPACGSGNFLTETYISLRRIENEILRLKNNKITIGFEEKNLNPIKVSIDQFYGIEINDFAVSVAKTALWIAEAQMLEETKHIVYSNIEFFPLKTYTNITEGNALRVDWNDVISKEHINYIMGNPPFVGHQNRNAEQIIDMQIAFQDLDKHGKLDYVCAWYSKAIDFMTNTKIKCAFVSTNSICQGESVPVLWRYLMDNKGLEIQYAYQSFVWNSEATKKAHVNCIIIGFTAYKTTNQKSIYSNGICHKVKHINGYLLNAPDIYVENRGKSLTKGIPEIIKGSQATDGGFLILNQQEALKMETEYPVMKNYIKQYIGGNEFINNKKRYCLWFVGANPTDYRKIPDVINRLEKVKNIRLKSPTKAVRDASKYPMLFTQIRQPEAGEYLIIPRVSSESRLYIPIGYVSSEIIASDSTQIIPSASLYIFGILTSKVHNAWMRAICGRLEMRYRYSPAVYNNFPWPKSTDDFKKIIENTANGILEARKLYPEATMADLYDDLVMPIELRKAHEANDKAVMDAYGFKHDMTESEIVAKLMEMYKKLTS